MAERFFFSTIWKFMTPVTISWTKMTLAGKITASKFRAMMICRVLKILHSCDITPLSTRLRANDSPKPDVSKVPAASAISISVIVSALYISYRGISCSKTMYSSSSINLYGEELASVRVYPFESKGSGTKK